VATCPSGHASASDDFCDVCGIRIAAADGTLAAGSLDGGLAASAPGPTVSAAALPAEAPPAEPCPRCGIERAGQFCENCGYNFAAPAATVFAPQPSVAGPTLAPQPPTPAPQPSVAGSTLAPQPPVTPPAASPPPDPAATWTAVVTADRDYYDQMRAASDSDAAAIDFPSYCPERRFRLSGTEVRIGRRSASRGLEPEIDLTGPPADPGVSRLHAVLLTGPDGAWSILDPGSANGTLVNGSEIPRDETMALADGDRIHLGAWTRITISRD
jgi:pSer/pThr/pTyr-binding forkhead associated (FHA) protein